MNGSQRSKSLDNVLTVNDKLNMLALCKHCKEDVELCITEQAIADGRIQMRADCSVCGRYIKYVSQQKEVKSVDPNFERPTLESIKRMIIK